MIERRITQQDVVPLAVKQRHIDGSILFTGSEADLPSGQTEVKFYYSTDTEILFVWNETDQAWDSWTFNPSFDTDWVGARAYLGTSQDNVANDTWTKVTLQTENYDTGSDFDTTTYRFTAPTTGYYQVSARVTWATTTANKNYAGAIYKGGNPYSISMVVGGFTGGEYFSCALSDLIPLDQGDYLELYCYQNTGATTSDLVADTNYTFMSVSLANVSVSV